MAGSSSALNDDRTPLLGDQVTSTTATVPTPRRPLDPVQRLSGPVRGRVVPGTVTAGVIGAGASTVAYLALFAHDLGSHWTSWAVAAGLAAAGTVAAATHRAVARLGLPGVGRVAAVVVVSLIPVLLRPSLADLAVLVGCAAAVAGIVHWATSSRVYTGGETAVFVGLPSALAAAAGPHGLVVAGLALVAAMVVSVALHRPGGRIAATAAGIVVPVGLAVLAIGDGWKTGSAHVWPVWVITLAALVSAIGVQIAKVGRRR